MFLVKSWTNGTIAKCMDEDPPATFDNCFRVKNSCFKYLVIFSKSFVIFSCGTLKRDYLMPMVVANQFSFVLGLKSLFPLLITKPKERKSFITSLLTDLVTSKPRNAAMRLQYK